jgi:hypothetical protein
MGRQAYYSCYFMDGRLTIRGIATVVAGSDDEASRLANDLLADRDARAVEVWEGARRVDFIEQPGDEQAGGHLVS